MIRHVSIWTILNIFGGIRMNRKWYGIWTYEGSLIWTNIIRSEWEDSWKNAWGYGGTRKWTKQAEIGLTVSVLEKALLGLIMLGEFLRTMRILFFCSTKRADKTWKKKHSGTSRNIE